MSRVPRTALNFRSFPGVLWVSVILPHVCDQGTFRRTWLNMNSILVFFTYLGHIPKGYLQSSFWIVYLFIYFGLELKVLTSTGKLTSSKVSMYRKIKKPGENPLSSLHLFILQVYSEHSGTVGWGFLFFFSAKALQADTAIPCLLQQIQSVSCLLSFNKHTPPRKINIRLLPSLKVFFKYVSAEIQTSSIVSFITAYSLWL